MFKIFLLIVLPVYATSLQSCFQCSGTDCVALNLEFNSVQCADENDECFTIFDGFTPIKRDCTSSLTDAEKQICDTATNYLCNKCNNADNCNYLSRNDHKCTYCSSLADQRCLTNPSSMPTVQCAATTLGKALCYVKTIGKTTERSCMTERTSLQSCEKQPESCSVCETSTATTPCNNYEFPANRRKCYQCTNAECTVAQLSSSYCDDPSDNCVVLKSSTNHKLACEKQLSTDEQLFCANNPNLCFYCGTNACNLPTIELSEVTCRSCSSETNSQCVLHPESVITATCQSGCYTKLTNGQTQTITRDCIENLSESDRIQCTEENDSSSSICRKCGTSNCNSAIFPTNRLSCHKCNGDCTSSIQQICSTYQPDDKCMTVYTNEHHTEVKRADCQSAINLSSECANGLCTNCTGANCNNPSQSLKPISCGVCNSQNNKKCSTEPATIESVECSNITMATNKCYMQIINGSTSRGCAANLNDPNSCLSQDGLCTMCDEPNCNKVVFPANRLRCHICDSLSDPNCGSIQSSKTPEICPNYYDDELCYTFATSEGVINRGCGNQRLFTCSNNYQSCSVCNSAGCNSNLVTVTTTSSTTTSTTTSSSTTTTTTTTTTASPPGGNVTLPNNETTTTTKKPSAAITFNFNFYLLIITIFLYLIN